MKEKIATWAAIAMMALAPVFAKAQENPMPAPEPPLVMFNSAGSVVNNSLTLAMRQNEIGLSGISSDKGHALGILANYNLDLKDGVKVGVGTAWASMLTYEGKKTEVITPTVAVELGTAAGKFTFGFKLPYTLKNGEYQPNALTIALLYQNGFGGYTAKVGAELTPGTENYKQAANITAELMKGKLGFAGNLVLGENAKAKINAGIGRKLPKGWQIEGSLAPEKSFFKGRMNPEITLRKVTSDLTFTVKYAPQTQTGKLTVGYKF